MTKTSAFSSIGGSPQSTKHARAGARPAGDKPDLIDAEQGEVSRRWALRDELSRVLHRRPGLRGQTGEAVCLGQDYGASTAFAPLAGYLSQTAYGGREAGMARALRKAKA